MQLEICVICASNQNRSMEAHFLLKQAGFNPDSYGTGSAVRLPGPAIDKPNIFAFGTPYQEIYDKLKSQDARLYTQNGVLKMIDRNRNVKKAPEKWQESVKRYDLIITCEERCFDAVVEDLQSRGEAQNRVVHVVNIDIRDSHEDAAIGGQAILELVKELNASAEIEEYDTKAADIVVDWQKKHRQLPILHTIAFY